MALFDDICNLAQKKDAQTLSRKINEEKVCIDVRKGIYTPVTLFAQQGRKDVVTFLISEFNANQDEAVRGYAIGGHTAEVDALLALSANRDYAAKGYVIGRYAAQLDANFILQANRDYAVSGYAIGGHTAEVDALLALGVNRDEAVRGYAIGGHTAEVDALLASGINRDEAVRGYAIGGHTAEVGALLALGVNRDEAVRGYAIGGHTAEVDALLASGVNRDEAVRGYAIGGHTAEVDALLASGINRDEAVRGYAEGGHTAQVDALLALGVNRDEAVRGYAIGRHIENSEKLLRVMVLTDNESLRNALPQHALCKISRVFLRKSRNLMQLMKENHLSYPWARVFTPTLNFLFLQGHLLMEKGNLPLDMLLKISSFISGFSEEDTHTLLSRHYVSNSNQLKAGRNTSLFRRQASLVNTIAPSERNFLLVPVAELTVEDKSLTVKKSELRALLYERYSKKRHTFFSHGACSKILNLDGSTTIKQLKALLENTPGDAISLEAVRQAIHRSKIDFSENNEKSGTDFVLTQIREKFTDASREQQNSAKSHRN